MADTAEYHGPEADARAERVRATLGTDAESLRDTVWLLRYTTVRHQSPQAMAYADFDRWVAEQSEDVQDMDLLDQIELYGRVS